MFNTMPTHHLGLDSKHVDHKNFQRLFRLTFVLFLLVAVFQRLLPKDKQSYVSMRDHRESVIDAARRKANTVLPFVFIR